MAYDISQVGQVDPRTGQPIGVFDWIGSAFNTGEQNAQTQANTQAAQANQEIIRQRQKAQQEAQQRASEQYAQYQQQTGQYGQQAQSNLDYLKSLNPEAAYQYAQGNAQKQAADISGAATNQSVMGARSAGLSPGLAGLAAAQANAGTYQQAYNQSLGQGLNQYNQSTAQQLQGRQAAQNQNLAYLQSLANQYQQGQGQAVGTGQAAMTQPTDVFGNIFGGVTKIAGSLSGIPTGAPQA